MAGKAAAPETTIVAGPVAGGVSTASDATFAFRSSIPGSTFSCSLDYAGFQACPPPTSYAGLADASHSFRVRATAAGRTDRSPATVSWTVKASVAPAPAPSPAPTPSPVSAPRTSWAPVGTPPLGDAAAAALVTRRPENRPANATANAAVPSDADLLAYRAATNPYGETTTQVSPLAGSVTGRPGLAAPSTDDLIQWTAHKWGIPEDLIRAQMTVESRWNQSAMGDRTAVGASWHAQYPSIARIAGTSEVYQSMGVMQVKWLPDGGVGPGTEPVRWRSTAFNLDYYGAVVRYYYDGHCRWCSAGYGPGQAWASVGAWFSPQPWNSSLTASYVTKVQSALAARAWQEPGF